MIEGSLPAPTGMVTDARTTVEAIACRYQTGIAWRDLAEVFGRGTGCGPGMAADGSWDRALAKLAAAADSAGSSIGRSRSTPRSLAHQHATTPPATTNSPSSTAPPRF
ncbi:hypothetical protein ITJ67_01720 [Pseudoclavibacter sp. VKM Ac-2867]|nr:hypothetical protein [Pseudoclavibacter sp. VKM Ac-2867]